MDLATTSQAVTTAAQASGDVPSWLAPLRDAMEFLKTGGPYALSVIAAYWGFSKDREAKKTQESAAASAKAAYDQMVALVSAQTSAMVKLESTVDALKDVIQMLSNRECPKAVRREGV